MKHPMCVCFHFKDAKNETFVSCRTFLRTFYELAFALQASRTKPAVSSFHKTSHVRVFLCKNVQVVKFAIWRMFLRTFLLILSFLRQPHVIKKTVVSPFLKTAHVPMFLLLDAQE